MSWWLSLASFFLLGGEPPAPTFFSINAKPNYKERQREEAEKDLFLEGKTKLSLEHNCGTG